MRAGPLRHRCRLSKYERVQNDTGGYDQEWVPAGELWTEITIPTGRTQPVAERLEATVTAEIRIRPRSDITIGWRLTERSTGMTYKVEAMLPNNERDMLRLLCSSVPNP
ncbi:phage head closure protein [Pseudomonas monteilii]|uniref:Head-tail adaptor protein n=1 Tax=Pseudomonas monteilii TaxID=76759 RepID=A0AAP7KE36_9PSED|nr:phage head closure protein [Pseudomonas monteilii]MCE0981690.1 phage head closure protein [Pseudomonas monteilii]OAH45513.1 head-tail adaptor protein [Pseudomonas monteilii]